MMIWHWFRRLFSGKPHVVIGGDDPYMLRWHLIPRNRWLNVYLHRFLRSDDDRAMHDHPWSSLSIVLWGGYYEYTLQGGTPGLAWWRRPGSIIYRPAEFRHRISLAMDRRHVWTLFITGPKVREWGFWCPRGFVPWREFTSPSDPGAIGRGCEE